LGAVLASLVWLACCQNANVKSANATLDAERQAAKKREDLESERPAENPFRPKPKQ
jgi:hypothetical protein